MSEARNHRRRQRRQKTLQRIIEYMGGGCQRCGYNYCSAALELHHIDPSKKEFQISDRLDVQWATIRRELDKCVMLCSNCHRELHAGVWCDA